MCNVGDNFCSVERWYELDPMLQLFEVFIVSLNNVRNIVIFRQDRDFIMFITKTMLIMRLVLTISTFILKSWENLNQTFHEDYHWEKIVIYDEFCTGENVGKEILNLTFMRPSYSRSWLWCPYRTWIQLQSGKRMVTTKKLLINLTVLPRPPLKTPLYFKALMEKKLTEIIDVWRLNTWNYLAHGQPECGTKRKEKRKVFIYAF